MNAPPAKSEHILTIIDVWQCVQILLMLECLIENVSTVQLIVYTAFQT